jgi:hypothetical protein
MSDFQRVEPGIYRITGDRGGLQDLGKIEVEVFPESLNTVQAKWLMNDLNRVVRALEGDNRQARLCRVGKA